MKLSRRDFLSLLAVAGSTACVGGLDAKQRSLELIGAWPDGEETWTPTICRECPAACGLLGRVVDG
ncbi:MAG TPA: twin-arginine translocation signal domain-containing protein, partial [Myxococcota bacterium]|nr:twin-arginine translocation signal domain-containing protein [Myxococcota bacterium]